MDIAGWVFGPQITGSLFFIIGLMLYWFPPKHINKWYGYRMPSALKNQQAWDEANRYCAIYFIKSGLIVLILGLIITAVLKKVLIPFKIKEALTVSLFMLSGIVPALFSIMATEKHLEKTFDQKPL